MLVQAGDSPEKDLHPVVAAELCLGREKGRGKGREKVREKWRGNGREKVREKVRGKGRGKVIEKWRGKGREKGRE